MTSHKKLTAAVVRIKTPAREGTGFYVAPRYVLTAWHVVKGASVCDVVHPGDHASNNGEVVGDGCDEKLDFALIRVDSEGSDWLPTIALDPDRVQAGKPLKFEARGFPHHGEASALTGTLSIVESDRLELFADQLAASEREKAEGFSGGPVLVDGRVAGIVRDYLRGEKGGATGGTFDACPMRAVLANERCAEAIGEIEHAESRRRAAEEIEQLLTSHEALVKTLAKSLDLGANAEKWPSLASEKLVGLSASQAIRILTGVTRKLRREKGYRDSANAVKSIYCHLLPLFDECRSSIQELRRQLAPGGKATVQGATLAYAEVLSAGIDARPCAFVLRPGGIAGSGMVPLALSPEEGVDLKGSRFVEAAIEHLAGELYVENRAAAVEGALRSIIDAGSSDYPPYFLALREQVYALYHASIDSLLSTLRSLRLIVLTGDDRKAEEEMLMIHPVIRLYAEDERPREET